MASWENLALVRIDYYQERESVVILHYVSAWEFKEKVEPNQEALPDVSKLPLAGASYRSLMAALTVMSP